jgi:hypothetical protein
MNKVFLIYLYLYRDELDSSNNSHWYKFDDTDVSECKMDDDEELRQQCFGGDHPTSAFDQPSMKRYIELNYILMNNLFFK